MPRLRFFTTMARDCFRPVLPAPHHPLPAMWKPGDVTAAWLGHATVLINFFGVTILTDPVFFARCGIGAGPFIIGPKRYIASALRPAELPPIDLVLLSHAHMDHMDIRSLRALSRAAHSQASTASAGPSVVTATRSPAVVTAKSTADIFRRIPFREVTEIDWNQTREIQTPGGPVTITAYKLRHWGARMRTDDYRHYNAYVLERNGRRLCHMGDTARTDAHILSSRGPIDLLLAPIGAYYPWVNSHASPEETVAMAGEAQARYLIPIHHQTFKLSFEPLDEPIARFKAALHSDPTRIALTEIGQTFILPKS